MKTSKGVAAWSQLLMTLAVVLAVLLISGCGEQGNSSSEGAASGNLQAKQVETGEKIPEGKTAAKVFTMKDIKGLKHTEIFAKGALEHIFDGTINKKGNATGYHYDKVKDSKGKILPGTRSKEDKNGIFTAKVEVDGVKKNGFSSFYPDTWTPQEVVDAINEAYKEALDNPNNPQGDLWIGHSKNLEIDMYLTDQKKILTAYPIYRKE